jgi:two-component system, NarL family, nitrate/nitrite response regulator NarL
MRIAVHAPPAFVDSLAATTDRLLLSPVETNLEISARVSQADVILVDVAGLGQRGLDDITSLQLDRPVLAVVKRDQAKAALAAGADGVLFESTKAERLEAALQALHQGMAVVEPAVLSGMSSSPASAASTSTQVASGTMLTHREQEVIVLMAEGLSNKQIAAQLSISEHTAKFHVNSILQKMNAQKRVEAVVRAAKAGILNL